MATYKDVMKWVAELDVRDAVTGFKKLEQEGRDALGRVSDEADATEGKMTSRFGDIGGKIGKGMSAAFAAVGVGALMVEALQSSWERAGGIRRITGQFRLSAEEAARYGEEAGELYADGWGDSVVEMQQVVALAGQRLKDTTDETLGEISAQIQAVADTWGADYESVIRSITQLTDNGLAPSSQAALDLIVTGFQDGADEAGDFLDTIDEYSQHWQAMGLSGEDALNMIIAGFQGGQRDADKLADAVKEFRIRAVEDTDAITEAYETLGFNADETREKFLAGGDSAREAYLEVLNALRSVEDPVEQNRLAVELIGTQFEDLGPKALEALTSVRGQLRETEGAAQDLADTVGEVSPWEDLKREGTETLGKVGDVMANQFGPMLRDTNDFIDGLSDGFGLFGDEVVEASDTVKDATEILKEMRDDAIQELIDGSGELRDDFTTAMDAVERSIDDARDATDEKAQADREAEEAARRHRQEIRHIRDEFGALKAEMSDRSAYLDVKDSFDDVQAAAEAAWTAAAEGSEDAERKARDYERAQMDLTAEVLAYEEEVGGLPDRVVTDIISLIDQGKLAEAEAALERLERARTINYQPVVLPPRQPGGYSMSHVGSRVGPGEHRQVLAGESFVPDVPGRIDSREDTRRAMTGRPPAGGDRSAPLVHVEHLHVEDRADIDAFAAAVNARMRI